MTTSEAPSPAAKPDRYPPEAFYVIGTEGAERFSFYGLTAILTLHMIRNLHFTEAEAVARFSFFNALVYLAPLFGGWLSDRYFGRYRTILWVSFGYVLGHGILAVWTSITGLYVGCILIALGAGGIKPNVSAFMGDQFRPDQQRMIERAYGWFYFSINVGSSFGVLLVPEVFERKGASLAFALPGVAMAVALIIYIMGSRRYRKLPPTGSVPDGFFAVLFYAASSAKPAAGQSRLDACAPRFSNNAVSGVRATLRIAVVFALVSVFWALFFQYGSSWVIQAERMNRDIFGWHMSSGQVSLLNSLFVLSLIPVMNAVYKRASEKGRALTPLRKMTIGMYIASLSFAAALVVQIFVDRGQDPHALWQAFQYFFLSLAEVLISVTGLEFAYTQAPPSMKSVLMGVWFLCISLGSLLTGVVAKSFVAIVGEPIHWQMFYGFFFALMLVAAVLFTFVARWYKPVRFDEASS
jgi:proton-dependent oligopeptide transporter, POT family